LLVIAALISLIYFQWQNITARISNTTVGIAQLFGWGMILAVLAILTFIVIILVKRVLLLRYWNKWIGGLIIFGAIWGILAFFPAQGYLEQVSLGGRIGQRIIGQSVLMGLLIVLGLILVGLFFAFPEKFAHLISNIFARVFGRLKKTPAEASEAPLPEPSFSPKLPAHNAGQEPHLRPSGFPRYKSELRPKNPGPVYGSKHWLWASLHPAPEPPIEFDPSPPQTAGKTVTVELAPLAEADLAGIKPATSVAESTQGADPEENKEDPESASQANGSSKDTKQIAQETLGKYGEAGIWIGSDGWKLPPIEILDNTPEFSQADNLKKARLIQDALGNYGIEGEVVRINADPTVTQVGLDPDLDRKQTEIRVRGIISATGHMLEYRDVYTASHQKRVATLARAIAGEMRLSEEVIEGVYLAAQIHDIGKIAVPSDILNKPGRISELEFGIIKEHPQTGFEILKNIEFPWPIAQIVLQHQERFDGSGYPRKLANKDILLEARILGVADTVEAMASYRPYRPALGIDSAIAEITQKKGTLYDPEVVDACLRLITENGFKFE
jgi:putative nucleotidyltransferase with HDIG domain